MGTVFFVFMINICILILYVPIKMCAMKSRRAKTLSKKMEKALFFRWWIIFVQEAYLDLFLAVCINLHNIDSSWWSSIDDIFNNILVIVILALLLALPLFILAYLCPNYRKLKKKVFM